jgi:hypothetical protein
VSVELHADTAGDAGPPLASPVEEGARIAAAARGRGLAVRIGGGVAVALRCPSSQTPPLVRSYADIDLFARRKESKQVAELMGALGYVPDRQFNALHGARRLFFWDAANERQVDVFLDVFEMCHRLDLSKRLLLPGDTLPLADLLLSKLQIVETNEKDLTDMLTILVDHPLTENEEGINLAYIAGLTSADWGLWRTTTMAAEKADQHARQIEGFAGRARVHDGVRTLLERLEREPKTRAWKLRARVGPRVRWFELPEEAH